MKPISTFSLLNLTAFEEVGEEGAVAKGMLLVTSRRMRNPALRAQTQDSWRWCVCVRNERNFRTIIIFYLLIE